MNKTELLDTIRKICAPGKGILAADESTGTIGKRFDGIQLQNTRENRVAYRELLFTTPNLNQHISGVITYEETLFDKVVNSNGSDTRLIQPLLDADIVVGIKVDQGVMPLYGTNGESVTQGLDDLDVRCKKYYNAGARFAKWRAVLKVDTKNHLPSDLAIHENAVTLARYASICQNNGLVPIVEPEILMDGTHTSLQARDIAIEVLSVVYRELQRHRVDVECTLLKPNMVRPGVSSTEKLDCVILAEHTIHAFQHTIPPIMPGVVFLSGGMSEVEASVALNEINKYPHAAKPWRLTFSYGRALQASVMDVWKGAPENKDAAQQMLLKRAKANGLASNGEYIAESTDAVSLHEKDYVY
jgi:fructose-bisphosphate aldolase, class I